MVSLWTFFWLFGGEVSGSQHHQPSGSNQSGVYVLMDSISLTFPTWWGFQYLQNSSKILLGISLEGEPGMFPKAALLFLDLFLPCLPMHVQSPNCVWLWPHGLQPTRLLCPWDVPDKNTGVGCRFLLQGIILTQGLNPCLLHWRVLSFPLSHPGSAVSTWLLQLLHMGSGVAAHRLSCATAHGIFQNQGSIRCLLHHKSNS